MRIRHRWEAGRASRQPRPGRAREQTRPSYYVRLLGAPNRGRVDHHGRGKVWCTILQVRYCTVR